MRLPSEHQLKTISYIEDNLKSEKVVFEGESYADAGRFISRNIEASKKAREKKKNEGIKFLFEMCEELVKDDKETGKDSRIQKIILKKTKNLDLSQFDTSNVTDMS